MAHTNWANGVKVARRSLAEDELGWGLVLGGVGDRVSLTSNNTRARVVIDLELSAGSSDQGSAGKEGLEETHVDGGVVWLVIR
jgi:hypothetical protein